MTREKLINKYKSENHIRESYKLTIGENYLINKLLEAINYTPCCTELKDKEAMTFEEYLEDNHLSQTYIWLSRQGMTDSASKIHRDWQLTLDPNL